MQGLQAPNYQDLQHYAVNNPDLLEIIYEPLFDFAAYPQLGAQSLNFFQQQVGSGGKTFEDTNMPGNGFLPNPQYFMVTGIAVEFYPPAVPGRAGDDDFATNWNDLYTVFQTGLLKFTIGEKAYQTQGPIGMFPPTYRLAGAAALTGTGTGALIEGIDYAVVAGAAFRITPVTLPPMQNWVVNLSWVTPVPVTDESRIGVRLFGFKYRAVQ